MKYLRTISHTILDTLFPPQCIHCKKEGHLLCASCKDQILPQHEPWAKENIPLYLEELIIASSYKNVILMKAIAQYKYRFTKEFSFFFAELLASVLPLRSEDVLIPVPLSVRRKWWRGFNQAEEIANILSEKTGAPMITPLLRIRHTKQQVSLSRTERLNNVVSAFALDLTYDISSLQNKRIFLIDDVATTGATLSECAKALRAQGICNVWGAVLARG